MKNKSSYIGLIFFLVIGILPFGLALGYALLYSFGIVGIINEGFTLQFWEEILTNGEFIQSFGFSALVSFISVALSVTSALWLAIRYKTDLNKRFLSFAIYLPLAVPGVVSAFFTLQLFSKSGFFSRIAFQLGAIDTIKEFPSLVNDSFAIGIILTFITLVLPFFLLLFLNIYKNERVDELVTLATTLGATRRQAIRHVSIPILLRKSWKLIALYFIFLLGSYEVPLILGRESPQMLSVLVVRELKQFDLTKISEGYVIAAIYTVAVSLAAIILFSKRNRNAYEA
ncbi:MAG: putative spermidine/putrescine transport system permease protein [Marivirga sp.]